MNKNIVLIGMSGTGKSTLSKELAKRLGYEHIDLDQEIIRHENMEIPHIFEKHGESYFRDLESKLNLDFSKKYSQVIATGGGIILRQDNIKNLKENGLIFLLEADMETLDRHLRGKGDRPLLDDDNLKKDLTAMWEARKEKYYGSADFIINIVGKDIDDIVEELLDVYKSC